MPRKTNCRNLKPSEGDRKVEPMFAMRKTFNSRIADAIDLAIDFSTLGEYGLEAVGPHPCEARTRALSTPGRISARPGRARTKRGGHETIPA